MQGSYEGISFQLVQTPITSVDIDPQLEFEGSESFIMQSYYLPLGTREEQVYGAWNCVDLQSQDVDVEQYILDPYLKFFSPYPCACKVCTLNFRQSTQLVLASRPGVRRGFRPETVQSR